MRNIKDSQLHIRCTADQKRDVKEILRKMGKTSDFLVELFLDTYNDNAADLEIQQYFIDKELENIQEEVSSLKLKEEQLKLRRNAITEELKNKNLYDISYYDEDNNKPLLDAVNSVKDYVLQRKIKNVDDIPENVFYNIDDRFKVNNVGLIIEISKNEYDKWYAELMEADKPSATDKMQKIADRLNTDFKAQGKYTNWDDYIESRNDYIESKADADDDLHPVDLKLYLSRKNYDHKYKFQKK